MLKNKNVNTVNKVFYQKAKEDQIRTKIWAKNIHTG